MAGNEKEISIQKFNQNKNLDKIILVSPFGLGDTMNLCGYRKAIEKYYNAPAHFVIKPTHEIVMKIYGIEDYSFQVFDKPELKEFAKKNAKVKVGEYFVAHPSFLNDDYKIINEFKGLKVSFIEVFRKTLGLPDDTEFEYPTIEPVMSKELKNRVEKFSPLEKIALFSPEAFSTNKIVPETLEEELKKDEFIKINGRFFKNVFFNKEELKSKIKTVYPESFSLIQGDCTFFYGDVDYDWKKLYYSLVGDDDQFNRKKFTLDIREPEVEIIWLSLTTYAWEDYDSICGAFYNGIIKLNEVLE